MLKKYLMIFLLLMILTTSAFSLTLNDILSTKTISGKLYTGKATATGSCGNGEKDGSEICDTKKYTGKTESGIGLCAVGDQYFEDNSEVKRQEDGYRCYRQCQNGKGYAYYWVCQECDKGYVFADQPGEHWWAGRCNDYCNIDGFEVDPLCDTKLPGDKCGPNNICSDNCLCLKSDSSATSTTLIPEKPEEREEINVLANPSFEGGWSDVGPSKQQPNGWSLTWTSSPECIHKSKDFLPKDEWLGGPKALILDQAWTYKIFQGGNPFSATLTQTISGLEPETEIDLVVPIQVHLQGRAGIEQTTIKLKLNNDEAVVQSQDRKWVYGAVQTKVPSNGQVNVIIHFESTSLAGIDFFIDNLKTYKIVNIPETTSTTIVTTITTSTTTFTTTTTTIDNCNFDNIDDCTKNGCGWCKYQDTEYYHPSVCKRGSVAGPDDASYCLSWIWVGVIPSSSTTSTTSTTTTTTTSNLCGNGFLDSGEVCDREKSGVCQGCRARCRVDIGLHAYDFCKSDCSGYYSLTDCCSECGSISIECNGKNHGDTCAPDKVCNDDCQCEDEEPSSSTTTSTTIKSTTTSTTTSTSTTTISSEPTCRPEEIGYPTEKWDTIWCEFDPNTKKLTKKLSDEPDFSINWRDHFTHELLYSIDEDWSWGKVGEIRNDEIGFISGRNIPFEEGLEYNFEIGVDDGFRLYVDDVLICESWDDPEPINRFEIFSKPKICKYSVDETGYKNVRLDYYENSGFASIDFMINKPI